MPRRAGRPPSAPLPRSPASQAAVPPAQDDDPPTAASAFEDIWPADQTNVQCRICSQEVAEISTHLQDLHPRISVEQYRAEYPDAPLQGTAPAELPELRLTVSPAEVEGHPGGREGAMTEKMLPRHERRLFREDVASLVRENFPVGHLLVTTAYQQVLHRRLSLDFERVQQTSKNGVFPGETFDRMQEISLLITKSHTELEKMRANRITTENPLELIEREQAKAEQWVVEHQGEFSEACPGCGLILTPPALPHWAFEPVQTPVGVEHMVWSRELWILVVNRVIRLWVMAFTLRTSPEGLRVTAQRRGENWPEEIVLEAEEVVLRRVLDAQDLQHRIGAPMLQLVGDVAAADPDPAVAEGPSVSGGDVVEGTERLNVNPHLPLEDEF